MSRCCGAIRTGAEQHPGRFSAFRCNAGLAGAAWPDQGPRPGRPNLLTARSGWPCARPCKPNGVPSHDLDRSRRRLLLDHYAGTRINPGLRRRAPTGPIDQALILANRRPWADVERNRLVPEEPWAPCPQPRCRNSPTSGTSTASALPVHWVLPMLEVNYRHVKRAIHLRQPHPCTPRRAAAGQPTGVRADPAPGGEHHGSHGGQRAACWRRVTTTRRSGPADRGASRT